jgi:hypothetical protein
MGTKDGGISRYKMDESDEGMDSRLVLVIPNLSALTLRMRGSRLILELSSQRLDDRIGLCLAL